MYPEPIKNVIRAISDFPTIGPKTAARIVFYLLKKGPLYLQSLTKELDLLRAVTRCAECNNYTVNARCALCSDTARNRAQLCIIEKPQDREIIEATQEYKGIYFILGGLLNPSKGSHIDETTLAQLEKKLAQPTSIKEIIIALNPTIEGESTSLFLIDRLKKYPVRISTLGKGVPLGSEIEYIDEYTLSYAFKKRQDVNKN